MFTPLFKEEILIKREYLIDLHTKLYSEERFYQDIERIFKEKNIVMIDNTPVPVMSIENNLTHLLLHSAAHFFRTRLINHLDIALFVECFHEKIDWENLGSKIRNDGNHIASFFPVMFAIKNFGIKIPEGFIKSTKPDYITIRYYSFFLDNKNPYLLKKNPGRWYKRAILTLPAIYGIKRKFKFIFWYIIRRGSAFVKKYY